MSTYNYQTRRTADAAISISDSVMTYYVNNADLPEQYSLREIAEHFAGTYDHNGVEGFACCVMEDLADGETVRFAFDEDGEFQWDLTERELQKLA